MQFFHDRRRWAHWVGWEIRGSGDRHGGVRRGTVRLVKGRERHAQGCVLIRPAAYPSPALTDDEWELIFESASSVNYIPFKSSQDLSIYDKEKGAENRKYLIEEYIKRNRLEMAMVDYSFDVLIDIGTHINPSP